MVKETYDWVDGCIFLMIACAELTDGYLEEQEIEVIIQKTAFYVSKLAGEDQTYTQQDVEQKFHKAFLWYTNIGEEAPQDNMDAELIKQVKQVAKSLKKEKWFNTYVAQQIIADLIEIARADGEVIKNEQNCITMISRIWGLSNPFYEA